MPVYLDDPVREFLATKPDSGASEQTVVERRALIHAGSDALFERFGQPADPAYAQQEFQLPASGVRVRVYRPSDEAGHPVHVFLHGGAFWLGSIDEMVVDATCRERCRGANCVVVAVNYRLAPEYPFPTPVEDCYEALVWALEHAEQIGGDATNVSIGGVSSGANLAAAVAIATRERLGYQMRLQLLEVPPLDLTWETARSSGVGDDYDMTCAELELAGRWYLQSPSDAYDMLASPLLAADLRDLPPARILAAEFDPLRDDAARYARRLEDANVPVRYTRQHGAVHGSLLLTGTWPPARAWRAAVITALRDAHQQRHPTPRSARTSAGAPAAVNRSRRP